MYSLGNKRGAVENFLGNKQSKPIQYLGEKIMAKTNVKSETNQNQQQRKSPLEK
jgi:hypothetical protein